MFKFYVIGIYVLIMLVIVIFDNLFSEKIIETSRVKECFSVNRKGIKIGDKKAFIKINMNTYIRTSMLYFSIYLISWLFIGVFNDDSNPLSSEQMALMFAIIISGFSIFGDITTTDINATEEEVLETIKTEKENIELEKEKRKRELDKNEVIPEIAILRIFMAILAGIALSFLFK